MQCPMTSSETGITQKVIVMRHGERRDANSDSAFELDPPLTDSGKAEVVRVASQLRPILGGEVNAQGVFLYVSPFLRTVETAAALQDNGIGSDRMMFVDNTLCEVFGPTHIKSSSPPTTLVEGHDTLPAWGESIEEALQRFVHSFLNNARRHYSNRASRSNLVDLRLSSIRNDEFDRTTLQEEKHLAALISEKHQEMNEIDDGHHNDFQPQAETTADTLCLITHGDAISSIISHFYPSRVVYQTDFLSYVVMGRCGESNTFRLIDSDGVRWIVDGVDKVPSYLESVANCPNLPILEGHQRIAAVETYEYALSSGPDADSPNISEGKLEFKQTEASSCAQHSSPSVQSNDKDYAQEAKALSSLFQDVNSKAALRCAFLRFNIHNSTEVNKVEEETIRSEDLPCAMPSVCSSSNAHSKIPLLGIVGSASISDYPLVRARFRLITYKKKLCVNFRLQLLMVLLQVGVIFQWNHAQNALIYLFCVNVVEVSQAVLLFLFSQPPLTGSSYDVPVPFQRAAVDAAYRALASTEVKKEKATEVQVKSSSISGHELDAGLEQRTSLLLSLPSIRANDLSNADLHGGNSTNENQNNQVSPDGHFCAFKVFWKGLAKLPINLLMCQFLETLLKIKMVFFFSLVFGFIFVYPFTMYLSLIEIFTYPLCSIPFLVYCMLDILRGLLYKM
ncbi:unnamed protein product [Phytomonas sp. Hart1]|nr:unnamed protein product [Phytomonas sp. Hart1]|eukprot:CCW69492.1 unnamed protein product [Phytomonas sp. isolate Hart1]